MDIKKLKAEFEKLKYIEEKLEYLNFDEHLDCYVEKSNGMPVGLAAWVNGAFYGFEQAATAQAVPEGFVLVKMDDLELLRDSTLKIKYASLSNDSDRIFSDIEDIQLSVERLIELQEPAND